MKAALLALSLLGQPLVPVSDRLPVVDVEVLCRDVSADDKASGLTQDASACVSDEKAAQQQLDTIWGTVPAGPRDSCESLAMSGGGRSYVDLLTCLQMAGWIKPDSAAATAPLKGASKNRNIKQ